MITRDLVFGCILRTDGLTVDGYAHHGKTLAHLAAWRAAGRTIPPGHVLDHGCNRRNCLAIPHLEAVTQHENLLRRSWAYRIKLARCPAGHDLQANRQATPEGGITCRLCTRAAVERWKAEG